MKSNKIRTTLFIMISQYVILDNLEMCNVKNVTDYYLIKKCKYILTKKIANVPKINKQENWQ
jgi:hypothetical protein